MTDQPLPGMPQPPNSRPLPHNPKLRVVRIRPVKLCERCCQLIHLLGQENAPYPRAARWKLVDEKSRESRLCDGHKDERTQR